MQNNILTFQTRRQSGASHHLQYICKRSIVGQQKESKESFVERECKQFQSTLHNFEILQHKQLFYFHFSNKDTQNKVPKPVKLEPKPFRPNVIFKLRKKKENRRKHTEQELKNLQILQVN